MKSKKIRIAPEIAIEIERLSLSLDISSSQASRIVFLKADSKRWGRPRKKKDWWNKTFPEAKVLYRRRMLVKDVINML